VQPDVLEFILGARVAKLDVKRHSLSAAWEACKAMIFCDTVVEG
jgi:hypothetical protein